MNESPRVDWRLPTVVATLLTVAFSLQNWLGANELTFGMSLMRQVIIWGVWLGLLPFVIRSARQRPLESRPTRDWMWSQLRLAIGYCVVHGVLTGTIRWTAGISVYPDLLDAILSNVFAIGRNLVTYLMIVAAYQAVVYHRAVRDRDLRAARLEIDLAEAKLDSLEGRLRPHFLFNTLNAIATLIRDDPNKAEVLIGQLSDLLRASLRADPSREVKLDEELELVGHYLAIERTRFQDRLSVTIDATAGARQGLVPHLILQPLVENSVRHGIAPRESGGRITVRAEQTDHRLVIAVEDDGVGMGNSPQSQQGAGIGLGGVRSRLAYLYGSAQTVAVTRVLPTGTRVVLEIPYRTASDPAGNTA